MADELRRILGLAGRINDADRREVTFAALAELGDGSARRSTPHGPDLEGLDPVAVMRRAESLLDEVGPSGGLYSYNLVTRCRLLLARLLVERGDRRTAFEAPRKIKWDFDFDPRLIDEVARHLTADLLEGLIAEALRIPNPEVQAMCVSPYLPYLPAERVAVLVGDLEGEIRGFVGTDQGLAALIPFQEPDRRSGLRNEILDRLLIDQEDLGPLAPLDLLAPWLEPDQAADVFRRLGTIDSLKLRVEYGLVLIAAMWPRPDALTELIRDASSIDKPERVLLFAKAIPQFRDPEACAGRSSRRRSAQPIPCMRTTCAARPCSGSCWNWRLGTVPSSCSTHSAPDSSVRSSPTDGRSWC